MRVSGLGVSILASTHGTKCNHVGIDYIVRIQTFLMGSLDVILVKSMILRHTS